MTINIFCPHFGEATGGPGQGLVRDFRILWTLEETGLPYKIEWRDVIKGAFKAKDYLQHNPFGRIPAIVDSKTGVTLFESGAVVRYLAERSGKLGTDKPENRAKIDQWMFFTAASLEPVTYGHFRTRVFEEDAPGNSWRQNNFAEQAAALLAPLNDTFGRQDYLLGSEFTIADLFMACVLRYGLGTDLYAASPALTAFMERCYARKAFKTAFDIHLSGPA